MLRLTGATLAILWLGGAVLTPETGDVTSARISSEEVRISVSRLDDPAPANATWFVRGAGKEAEPEGAVSDSEAVRIATARGAAIKAARETSASRPLMTVLGITQPEVEIQEVRAVAAAASETAPSWTITGDRVNMRSGPGTGYPVVGSATAGMAFIPVSDTSADWIEVDVPGGGTAWIFAKLISPEA